MSYATSVLLNVLGKNSDLQRIERTNPFNYNIVEA